MRMKIVLNNDELTSVCGGWHYNCYCLIGYDNNGWPIEDYQWSSRNNGDEKACWRNCRDKRRYINYRWLGDANE